MNVGPRSRTPYPLAPPSPLSRRPHRSPYRGVSTRRLLAAAAQLRQPPPPLSGQPVEPDLTPPPANTAARRGCRRHQHPPSSLPTFAASSHEVHAPPFRAPPLAPGRQIQPRTRRPMLTHRLRPQLPGPSGRPQQPRPAVRSSLCREGGGHAEEKERALPPPSAPAQAPAATPPGQGELDPATGASDPAARAA
ncbi:velvet complex subunit B-like [Miscanthus floridulus]|uniref:velvet complex subunit B-like n=1 Tax=Miscanthus floridulus TaxID=154761 RepID=UPI00345966D9